MANSGKADPLILTDILIMWSEVMLSTGVIQVICDQVMLNVMKKTGKNYKEFKAVFYTMSYISPYYIIKVYVGDEYLHLSVMQKASPTGEQVIELKEVQEGHKWNDDLEPFNWEN